jgi:hypothetical protein
MALGSGHPQLTGHRCNCWLAGNSTVRFEGAVYYVDFVRFSTKRPVRTIPSGPGPFSTIPPIEAPKDDHMSGISFWLLFIRSCALSDRLIGHQAPQMPVLCGKGVTSEGEDQSCEKVGFI